MKKCLSCGHRFQAEDWRCPQCGRSPGSRQGHWVFAPRLEEAFSDFEPRFFAELVAVEAGNFWFEARNCLLTWALRRYFTGARNFLEIGCGTGFVLAGIRRRCPQLTLSGSDALSQGLAYVEARVAGAMLFQADARFLPFVEEFDVVGAFDVLEHVQEDEAILAEAFCATRRGGGLILTVPQHPFLWSAVDDYGHHKRRYTRSELVAKVERAGFECLRVTSFVSLLLPLLVLSRRRQRKRGTVDPMAEFRISSPLNLLLRKAMDFEQRLIKGGFSFPAGGSLLVVARRD